MKKLLFGVIAVAGSTVLTLVLLEIVLQFLPVRTSIPVEPVTLENPVVHYRPHTPQTYSAGWNFDAHNESKTNAQGYIADFDFVKDGDKPLIGVVGDSYIEARMVPFADTLQERLRKALNDQYRVYGIGVGGAALSQYLIFAKMLRDEYKPGFLIVNIVNNDFDESMPRYKNVPRFHYFMPMEDGSFLPLLTDQYIPDPTRELICRSALVRYVYFNLNASDTINKIQFHQRGGTEDIAANEYEASMNFNTRLAFSRVAVDNFLGQLTTYSGLPSNRILLVVDGQRFDIYNGVDTKPESAGSYFGQMRSYLISEARQSGYEVIDLQPAFKNDYRRNRQRFDFAKDGHWNAAGHAIAASEALKSVNLQDYLKQ